MARPMRQAEERSEGLWQDDSSLGRLPAEEKRSWVSILFIRLGMISALTQFLVASTIGYSMSFWSAFWTTLIATVILEAVFILMGIAGAYEGLTLSVLSRWAGLGRYGSALVGLAIAVSLTGWFGVQNGLFAQSLVSATGHALPFWLAAILGGLLLTALVARGFTMLRWTAYVSVPAFFILAAWDVVTLILRHHALRYLWTPIPGPHLTIADGATVVVGALIVGALIAPDYARYNRTARDVVLQSVLGIALGEFGVGFVGFVLARAVRSPDIATIMTSVNGVLGALIVMLAVIKVNDINLYSSSLGWVNCLDVLFGRKVNRATVTVAFGVLGTILSALGMLSALVPFLTALGVALPPIAGVLMADYFVLGSQRSVLRQTRAAGTLPASVPGWNWAGLLAWAAGTAAGAFISFGVPSVNALLAAGLVYLAVGGLVPNLAAREGTTVA